MWASVGKPLLIAYGDADRTIPPTSSAQLAELTGATSLVFPGAGHAPFADDPVRFNDELAAFVARVTS
jgi:pimeloyl-ACP methyl ester carboxylesterase